MISASAKFVPRCFSVTQKKHNDFTDHDYRFRLLSEDMQRRIESIKLENNNEDEASAKISKVEEESVST